MAGEKSQVRGDAGLRRGVVPVRCVSCVGKSTVGLLCSGMHSHVPVQKRTAGRLDETGNRNSQLLVLASVYPWQHLRYSSFVHVVFRTNDGNIVTGFWEIVW